MSASEGTTQDLGLTGESASIHVLDNAGLEIMGIANNFEGISNGNDLERVFANTPATM